MQSDRLHVVVAMANPVRWESRIRLFREFAEHMIESGVQLTVVECAFGERPHELGQDSRYRHVAVRAAGHALVWNKETLLGIGIARLPDEARYIGTFDADIRFRQPDWASAAVHALQHYDIIQPWTTCYDLGPGGEHLELHRSFCRIWHDKEPIVQGPKAGMAPYRFAHPGFAWCWRRSALDALGGLVETAALGAGDHHMALALIGRVDESIPENMTPGYVWPLRVWQQRAERAIQRNLGALPGSIEHSFHGAKPKRNYVGRWEVLQRHKFDPLIHLVKNSYGVVELAPGFPALRHDIDLYFRSRQEDANFV